MQTYVPYVPVMCRLCAGYVPDSVWSALSSPNSTPKPEKAQTYLCATYVPPNGVMCRLCAKPWGGSWGLCADLCWGYVPHPFGLDLPKMRERTYVQVMCHLMCRGSGSWIEKCPKCVDVVMCRLCAKAAASPGGTQ